MLSEEELELIKEIFKEEPLSELKEIQRVLTKEIDIKQGYDGGKHLNKTKFKPSDLIPAVTAAMIGNPTPTRDLSCSPYYSTMVIGHQQLIDLAICPPVTVESGQASEQELKKEKKMYHDYDDDCNCAPVNVEARKMDYLKGRLNDLFCDKECALPKAFGLENDHPPHTPKEFVERILAGKFELKDKAKDTYLYGSSPSPYITWRDPKVKVDQEGYDKAYKTLQEEFTKAKDTIVIKSPEEGLKALEKFESKTFH